MPLFDPLPRWGVRARPAANGIPRISLPGVTAPFPLLLMFLGVIVASFFAAAPGIGGLLLLSLLMLFVFRFPLFGPTSLIASFHCGIIKSIDVTLVS